MFKYFRAYSDLSRNRVKWVGYAKLNLDSWRPMYYKNKNIRNTGDWRSDMPIVTSTIKGKIVIPAVIRAKFKIKKGTQVNVYDDGNRIIVEPLAEDPI